MNSHPRSRPPRPHPGSPDFLHDNQAANYGESVVQHNDSNLQRPPPVHVCSDAMDGFNHLQAHVATAAFDPKDKMDAPKCHPNTRLAVLDGIMDWVLQTVMIVEWIMWLNGAAGAGKSAIARSIVERCLKLGIPIARFFFFRTDPTRNTIDPIVATLAHQLIKCLPDLKMTIVTRIQEDPLIFSQSLETQFQHLIFEPLVLLKEQVECPQTVLLLFDGLDELSGDENQVDLINITAAFAASKMYPIMFFFGSRNEYQIKQAFESKPMCDLLRPVPLDNNYKPDEDIRLFLTESFSKIKATHPHRKLLPKSWPTPELVEEIVAKSSGQFIYASVVVKFLSMPKMNPAQQLEIIRGLRPAGALTPFAQLDALYLHIFSQVEDLPGTMRIVAAVILCKQSEILALFNLFPDHMSYSSIPVLLASLVSVISVGDSDIKFLHTSLSDFLLDHTRSQHFYIDRALYSAQLSTEFRRDHIATSFQFNSYAKLLWNAYPTKDLRQRLQTVYPEPGGYTADETSNYLLAIKNLDFGDGGEVYCLQLTHCIRHLKDKSRHLGKLAADHDISPILQEIENDRQVAGRQKKASWGARIIRRLTGWLKKLLLP